METKYNHFPEDPKDCFKCHDNRTHTPWEVTTLQNGQTAIKCSRGLIASMEAGYNTIRETDAAFIVRAVNQFEENQTELARLRAAHETLVKLIKEALKCMDVSCYVDAREYLNEVIAKAEGQTEHSSEAEGK